MKPATTNRILFERANIKVTDTRFDTGTDTFRIKRIRGVRVDIEKRQARIGFPLVAGGILTLLGGALANLPLLIVAGAALTVGGTILSFAKRNGTVILTMGRHDVRAISSKDMVLLSAVADALQAAIDRRG